MQNHRLGVHSDKLGRCYYRLIHRNCSLKRTPSQNGWVRLYNSSTYSPKRGSAPRIHQPKGGGSTSRFHQPVGGLPLELISIQPSKGGPSLEFIRLQSPKGPPPLEFMNVQLQNGGPPLGTITMDPLFYSADLSNWPMDNGCLIRTKNHETSKVVGFLGMSVGCPYKIHLCWKKCSLVTI